MPFESLSDAQLGRTWGGVHVQLTQFGYANDPYMDHNTRQGNGAYHKLVSNESVGMTTSALHALGLTPAIVRRDHPWVNVQLKGGGVVRRRIDDWGPERNARVDFYEPGGLDGGLGDSAEISLADGYVPRPMARVSHLSHRRHR